VLVEPPRVREPHGIVRADVDEDARTRATSAEPEQIFDDKILRVLRVARARFRTLRAATNATEHRFDRRERSAEKVSKRCHGRQYRAVSLRRRPLA
jgi:hypothetical protein